MAAIIPIIRINTLRTYWQHKLAKINIINIIKVRN